VGLYIIILMHIFSTCMYYDAVSVCGLTGPPSVGCNVAVPVNTVW